MLIPALYEALLGRRLERVRDHLGARVAVLLSGGRVGAARGALAAGLRRQRRQRAGRQQQRQQRAAHRQRHGGRVRAAARLHGRRGHGAVLVGPALGAHALVVDARAAARLAAGAVPARAVRVGGGVVAGVGQRAVVAAQPGRALAPAEQGAVSE